MSLLIRINFHFDYEDNTVKIVSVNRTSKQNKQNTIEEVKEFYVENKKSVIDVILRLTGYQKKLFDFVLEYCLSRGTFSTGPINVSVLVDAMQAPHNTVKTIITRLVDKNILVREKGKSGRGGFYIFSFNEITRTAGVEYKRLISGNGFLEQQYFTSKNNRVYSNNTDYTPHSELEITRNGSWINNIDLSRIQEALDKVTTKSKQFFGKAQLNLIYAAVGTKLSKEEIQKSLDEFAFGLKYLCSEKPYKDMENPGAVLFNHLKNGDKWTEPNFLSQDNICMYKIYVNIEKKMQEEIKIYFNKWFSVDKEKKYSHYQQSMRSTDFYDDRIFFEKAWADYEKNIWPNEKIELIKRFMEIDDDILLSKFNGLMKIGFMNK